MGDDVPHDEELRNDLAAQILAVLGMDRFFEQLDDRLCPATDSQEPNRCSGSYENSISVLREMGINQERMQDVFEMFAEKSASCDCEALYKVAGKSRFESEYMKANGLKSHAFNPHSRGREN
jgi:hypothetical protein